MTSRVFLKRDVNRGWLVLSYFSALTPYKLLTYPKLCKSFSFPPEGTDLDNLRIGCIHRAVYFPVLLVPVS